DGWFSLHQRFGRLDMGRVARDAIHYARDGFRLTQFTSDAIRTNAELLAQTGAGANVFLSNGSPPSAGDRLVQADLANTLEQLAAGGRDVMYSGPLGARLLEFLVANGAGLSAADFAGQRSEWVEPLSADYRGVAVMELPPNSQGVVLLEMLQMLDGHDLADWDTAERIHQLVERKKVAFADRDRYVADPSCADVPLDRLLGRHNVDISETA